MEIELCWYGLLSSKNSDEAREALLTVDDEHRIFLGGGFDAYGPEIHAGSRDGKGPEQETPHRITLMDAVE